MSLVRIPTPRGSIPSFVATPTGSGPWSGVVLVHDGLGMTEDLRSHARWLAAEGFLAAAPDLFHDGGHIRCLVRTMRELARGEERGRSQQALASVRDWLRARPNSTGLVGIMGFCLGGGFALALAPGHGYSASAANYGALTDQGWANLADACPILASYGADDPTLQGEGERLAQRLTQLRIPHDVKTYPGAGHGFMNDHSEDKVSWLFCVLNRLSRTRYDAEATEDARRRISAFFAEHLRRATGSPS